jgi:putative DNA primase/helicase
MPEVTVDAEAVPDELKERDQWLMWDASADAPRRPHWRGDFAVSWTDPDDWHSFQDAVEAAEETDSWGIGYVFARANDDFPRGLYGALDLDGCADEDGMPKDWLPSLDPFFDEDAYMERSPSGTGVHIPLVGFEPPEWWSNVHFSEDEHEGVEAYGKKFFTFTGDQLRGSGDGVADAGEFVEEWLLEVYTEITGEMPPELQPDDDEQREPEKSREEIEEIETTGNTDDVLDAVDHLRPSDLRLSSSYTEDENGDWESWDPGYRSSSSGTSLKRHKASGLFKDFAEAEPSRCTWFGLLDIFAAENGIISRPWDGLEGDDWWDAVEAARDAGASIPEYESSKRSPPPEPPEPDDEDDDDATRYTWDYVRDTYADDKGWGRVTAADALDERTHWMHIMESETLWVYDAETGYFNAWGEEYAAHLLEAHLGEHYSQTEKKEIIGRLEARHQTHREELNAGATGGYYLCVGNGVVDLETGELQDHDPAYKFTRGLAWDYDPASADPDPIREFLDDVTKREEDRDTLLDHLAHGLLPGHPFRAFVMMYGPGSNGKTRVGKLFRGFVGEDNAASVELQDLTGDDQFATGALPGAFINVGDDISVSEIRDVSILKSVTGSGTIRANEKYEKQYEFENEAAMFFSANEPPRIAEETDAIADRLYPIEMPYRFVDDPDPDDPHEKQKVTGVAQQLLDDEDAMQGLLLLAVKHAQELIESRGQYSMPETPTQRREIYEAASDPIRRFALDYLEQGDGTDAALKDDVYAVYRAMCEEENERVASTDGFKRQIAQQALIDVEDGRTRALSPGDDRERCWRYVRFAEDAKRVMPDRLQARYFGEDAVSAAPGDVEEEEDDDEETAFAATPIPDAATCLTGYVTVTAEVVTTQRLGEEEQGVKAILKDERGAIDVVTWEESFAQRLEEIEGECIVLEDAEVTEYDGTRQLSPVEGLTTIQTIQQGVAYTEGASPGEDQASLSSPDERTAETDGGSAVPEDAQGTLADARRLREVLEREGEPMNRGALFAAAADDLSPERAEEALRVAVKEKGFIMETEDGYVPT